jgi:hypothetical protein
MLRTTDQNHTVLKGRTNGAYKSPAFQAETAAMLVLRRSATCGYEDIA